MTVVDRQVFGPGGMYRGGFYAHQAAAAGLAFFIMGGAFWGRFYALGVTFWVLAMFMPMWPEMAPLAFGVAWAVALGLIARHLRRLAAASGEDRRTGKTDAMPTRTETPPT